MRSRAFLALAAAMALAACATYGAVVNLVPLLTERGISTGTAAVALGLGGAGQVLGRLGYGTLTRRSGVRARTVLVLAAVAATTALLGALTSLPALIAAAVLAGVVRGILTLLQATAITERWGATHYGQLTGALSAPVTLTAALAGTSGGYSPMFLTMAGVALLAAAAALGSIPAISGQPQPAHAR